MIKTISDLRSAKDEEVLELYEKAQGDTKNFQDNFGTEFSYSMIGRELQDRGYVQGWYKPGTGKEVKKVRVPFVKNRQRMNLAMTPEAKAKYEEFLSEKSYSFIHTSAALVCYIDAYEKGLVDVEVKV